jgi:hypothetical protein
MLTTSQLWWHTSVIPALERLRQKNPEFKASLDCIARTCPPKKKQTESWLPGGPINQQVKCMKPSFLPPGLKTYPKIPVKTLPPHQPNLWSNLPWDNVLPLLGHLFLPPHCPLLSFRQILSLSKPSLTPYWIRLWLKLSSFTENLEAFYYNAPQVFKLWLTTTPI